MYTKPSELLQSVTHTGAKITGFRGRVPRIYSGHANTNRPLDFVFENSSTRLIALRLEFSKTRHFKRKMDFSGDGLAPFPCKPLPRMEGYPLPTPRLLLATMPSDSAAASPEFLPDFRLTCRHAHMAGDVVCAVTPCRTLLAAVCCEQAALKAGTCRIARI